MMKNNIDCIDNKCCGCRACEFECPFQAIDFVENQEGFFYPQVNLEKCVSCGRCLRVCPSEKGIQTNYSQKGFAVFLKSKEKLCESSSGGAFTALAETILARGGYVCGCAYDEKFVPRHIVINSYDELKSLKGSKYVQSDMSQVYKELLKLLEAKETVLFVGTPCQVAGIKNLAGDKYKENLYCCDLICHGVPSRKLFKCYLEWLSEKEKGELIHYNFRSKKKNGWSLTYTAAFKAKRGKIKEIEKIASIDPYYELFIQGSTYRESCYSCDYSCGERVGDITLGDFWGIEKELPEMRNEYGVSAILINSLKGEELFFSTRNKLCSQEVDVEIIKRNNGNLKKTSVRPSCRDSIYKELLEGGITSFVRRQTKTFRYWKEKIRNILPNSFRQRLKTILRRR